ncbi:MAG: CDP-alcohol phosphatidyltransferase family protein [Nocardioides sp.]
MATVRSSLTASLAVLVVLLAALMTQGLGVRGVVVGLGCGAVLCAAVVRGHATLGVGGLGLADGVTLARATLACALAALVADPSLGPPASAMVVPFAVVALALDAVDGRVARSTGTVTAFGARFDGEADAFLLLVLSVHVAGSYGSWVLAIGVARYAFGVGGSVWPWLRATLPHRYWRKVVAAVQGVVLTVAAADVLPSAWTYVALGAALVLLAESFGRDVVWSWLHRAGPRIRVRVP